MTPQEELLAAAADIERNGHNKKTYFRNRDDGWRDAPACALGALARATGHVSDDGWVFGSHDVWLHSAESVNILATHIRSQIDVGPSLGFDDWDVISHFNDREDTTAEDVVRVMREAAQC